jgi:tetratricopeptide (TPR) repeat protein
MKGIQKIKFLLFVALFFALIFSCQQEMEKTETGSLGSIDFQNTGSPEAQDAFIRGVSALHSYWYDEAEEAFRNAHEIDPDFVMAYWGEAMSVNKTLWQRQDKEKALTILSQLGSDPQAWMSKTNDEKEKKYIESLGILYSDEEDKLTRDLAYKDYMQAFYEKYPDDNEVTAFYSLALLGILRNNQGNEKTRMEAGALAQEIIDRNPDHPGALHYLIHSMDDPMHARLALSAAYRYSEVAPEAHHARHMPSHIFVQLGMWDNVVKSNISSYGASQNWVKSKDLSITKYDSHSLAWMTYGYEQLGRFDKALENIDIIQANNSDTSSYSSRYYEVSMITRLWVEASYTDSLDLVLSFDEVERGMRLPWNFVQGWSSIRKNDESGYEKSLEVIVDLIEEFETDEKEFKMNLGLIYKNMLEGIYAFSNLNMDLFEEKFHEAIEIEESLNPPSGPPDIIKQVHELYAEYKLQMGDYESAIKYFSIQLERTANRSPSQLGMARAFSGLGDLEKAKNHYRQFAINYSEAKDHPYYDEATRFLIANPDSLMKLRSISFNYVKPEVYYDKRLKITDCPLPE